MARITILPAACLGVFLLFSQGAQATETAALAEAPLLLRPAVAMDLSALVRQGEYVARLGDCVACHTAPNTKPQDKVAGRGVGTISTALKPDAGNGSKVYAGQCAACHGEQGQGLARPDGRVVYPPLWGERSFNLGAGMARTSTAAAFVKRNMPVGVHDKFPLGQGGLSDQEAVDVAAYFSHQPRPDFAGKANDWPRDRKPADARY